MKQIIFLSLFILLIPSAIAIPYQYEISLKQQIDNNISFNEILCRNNSHVLVERINEKLACVYSDTAKKFNWIVQDEEIRENLWLINNPAVKDCVPKKVGDAWISMGYENKTHSFDVEFCEWSERN